MWALFYRRQYELRQQQYPTCYTYSSSLRPQDSFMPNFGFGDSTVQRHWNHFGMYRNRKDSSKRITVRRFVASACSFAPQQSSLSSTQLCHQALVPVKSLRSFNQWAISSQWELLAYTSLTVPYGVLLFTIARVAFTVWEWLLQWRISNAMSQRCQRSRCFFCAQQWNFYTNSGSNRSLEDFIRCRRMGCTVKSVRSVFNGSARPSEILGEERTRALIDACSTDEGDCADDALCKRVTVCEQQMYVDCLLSRCFYLERVEIEWSLGIRRRITGAFTGLSSGIAVVLLSGRESNATV